MIRLNTTCPDCNKDNSVFRHERRCGDCQLRGFMKSQIRAAEKDKQMREEVNQMKPALRDKLHKDILDELLKEQDEKEH